MFEAKLYQKLPNQQVRCQLCHHFCQISDGQLGICGVRQNIQGKLFSLNYGRLITEAIDPIEKKPIFHFLPGSESYSIATVGCNLRCDNCQNWEISQAPGVAPLGGAGANREIILPGYDVTAEEIVKRAIESGCQSISYTYTEPTIFFEFGLDCMKLARQNNLKNIWVTNGYMSQICLEEILPYLDAANVDLKFFNEEIYQKNCGCRLKPILENLKKIHLTKVNLEITTLIIPGLTDRLGQLPAIAQFIAQELSAEVPWHLSCFSPEISYKLTGLKATPPKLIDQAYSAGKQAGLKYVYVGNVWGDERQNTYCPNCQNLLVKRNGWQVKNYLTDNTCFKCANKLPLIIG